MNGSNPLHAGAWAFWLLATLIALAVTRNPVYIGLILGWIAVVWRAASAAHIMNPERAVPLSPVRFGIVVVSISAIFNALMVQAGGVVLFRLPAALPLVGGAFTLEGMVYGALNGLVLTGLYAAFLLVNRVLPVRDMVRLAPRAYYSVSIVVSMAVTFVPATLRQYEQIREAQAIRGHRIRGLRSWLPLLLPLLTGGMERALQLAEAMTARGFTGTDRPGSRAGTQAAIVVGLALFAAGLLLRLAWGYAAAGLIVMAAGAALVTVSVWAAGRAHPHTVYRPAPWQPQDWLTVAGAMVTAAFFLLPLPGLERSSLFYSPYPSLHEPGFSLWIGMSTWGLLVPAFVLAATRMRSSAGNGHMLGRGSRQAP